MRSNQKVSLDVTYLEVIIEWMRVQVIMTENMKMTVSWDTALCCLVEVDLLVCFKGAFCLHLPGDITPMIVTKHV